MKNLSNIQQAVDALQAGQVGVMPTDTVYGIVARATDKRAVARLYAIKHREHKPGTVIAASVQQLLDIGVEAHYLDKVKQWWPGPLSVETPYMSDLYPLDQETGHCAWRVVADLRVREILEQTGPLVTSSANQPGEPVSVNVKMAQEYFGQAVDFYLDGGEMTDRLPSTVIRTVGDEIVIIRPGAVEINAQGLNETPPIPPDCPFCLVNGKLKGAILFATEEAFLIEAASNPGSYLIVPQLHVETFDQLADEWWGQLREVLPNVPGLQLDYNLSANIGKLSGQTVKHLHFWVIPREARRPSSGLGLAALMTEVDRLASR